MTFTFLRTGLQGVRPAHTATMQFNFMNSLRKQMQKHLMGEPVQRYAQAWESLKEAVASKLSGDKRRQDHRFAADVKTLLKTMLDLLVEEMKEWTSKKATISGSDGAAPPVYEYMLKNDVVKVLCEYAKRSSLDLMLIHHLTDIVLFACPLLGHYKQATAPMLDLLQHTEERIQPWDVSEVSQDHQRCLSHGFVQLVYSISWQLYTAHSATECVDFFFVDRRKFAFDETGERPKSDETSFILLEFCLPYLKRRAEVVVAQEVDFSNDFKDSDRVHQIYTSEVAADVILCLVRLQNEQVIKYFESKAALVAEMVCMSLREICLDILNREDEDAYHTKDVLVDQLIRRLAIFEAVSLHPSQEFSNAFATSYYDRVLRPVFLDRLANQPQPWTNCGHVLELACYFLQNMEAPPFCDLLVHMLLGVDSDTTLRTGLLKSLDGDSDDMVPASLNVLLLLFRRRPFLTADTLLSPVLSEGSIPAADLPALRGLYDGIDDLFHPSLFRGKGRDTLPTEDQYVLHTRMHGAAMAERGISSNVPLAWTPGESSPSEPSGVSLPSLIVQKFATIFDQPIDVALVCVHASPPRPDPHLPTQHPIRCCSIFSPRLCI